MACLFSYPEKKLRTVRISKLKLHTQCHYQEDDFIFYTLCKQTGLSMYKAMPAMPLESC